jgi:AhpD family alkylhydroperoxidase
MVAAQKIGAAGGCGCSSASAGSNPAAELVTQQTSLEINLEDLIPIAVVVAAGCEPCAKKMVERALEQGSSKRQIQKILGIVAYMHKLDCLAGEIGPEALARMEKPLAMARRTLEEATISGGTR